MWMRCLQPCAGRMAEPRAGGLGRGGPGGMEGRGGPGGPQRPLAPDSLASCVAAILWTSDPAQKLALAKQTAKAWHQGRLALGRQIDAPALPDRPPPPEQPQLLAPRDMPRRRLGGLKGRVAHIHAIAHIEFSAIDMAFDLVGRFLFAGMPKSFYSDFIKVGVEEAKHFSLLQKRLKALGSHYGALPAHDGLWQVVGQTRNDLMARLAIVPMVLEARGLDVTPSMIARFERLGDFETARVLSLIHEEEKRHVRIGVHWFGHLCRQAGKVPESTFHDIVRTYFRGGLKPPFNDRARAQAGLSPGFYQPLSSAFAP